MSSIGRPVPAAPVPATVTPAPDHGPSRRAVVLGLVLGGLLLGGASVGLPAGPRINTRSTSAVNVDRGGLALRGHDPVALVEDGQALRGRATMAWSFDNAGYRFASPENLARFRGDPARYLPQYGGFAALDVAMGRKAAVDPRFFTVSGGRLFLHRDAEAKRLWEADLPGNMAAADAMWPRIRYTAPRALLEPP